MVTVLQRPSSLAAVKIWIWCFSHWKELEAWQLESWEEQDEQEEMEGNVKDKRVDMKRE